jgi:thiosulfate/3-mercaptopyruvate sulfurtransferase
VSILVGADAVPAGARLLDVRWDLGAPHGLAAYRAGHIPGAVFADLAAELASPSTPGEGRHPLPAPADLQAAARRWGVRRGQPVVVYDGGSGMGAARAWWTLRWGGAQDVRILDGGLPAWPGELETGDVTPAPGDVVLPGGAMPVLDADGAAALARDGVLLDARAPERFRGEVEPLDPVAGHIPGARNAPSAQNLGPDGRYLPPEELRARYEALGVRDGVAVGAYCGSGISAVQDIVALRLAGYDAVLYPGSWSAWVADRSRPVATGRRSG